MTTLYLNYEKYTTDNNDGDESGERYSYRGTTSTSWDFTDVAMRKGDESFVTDFDVKAGDIIHVVVAVWSTGDSFGHDSGHSMEVICAFKSADKAVALEQFIEANKKGDKLEYLTETGVEMKMSYVPWHGYFESLDYAKTLTMMVQA